jgi:hypothetical protein
MFNIKHRKASLQRGKVSFSCLGDCYALILIDILCALQHIETHIRVVLHAGLMKMSCKSPLGSRHPSAAIMTTKAKWAALGYGDPRRISETKMGSAFN